MEYHLHHIEPASPTELAIDESDSSTQLGTQYKVGGFGLELMGSGLKQVDLSSPIIQCVCIWVKRNSKLCNFKTKSLIC